MRTINPVSFHFCHLSPQRHVTEAVWKYPKGLWRLQPRAPLTHLVLCCQGVLGRNPPWQNCPEADLSLGFLWERAQLKVQRADFLYKWPEEKASRNTIAMDCSDLSEWAAQPLGSFPPSHLLPLSVTLLSQTKPHPTDPRAHFQAESTLTVPFLAGDEKRCDSRGSTVNGQQQLLANVRQ